MKPIRQLTHSKSTWEWSEVQESAFNELKSMISSTPVLAYYDPDKDLEIQCDSSQSGLGAALMQGGCPIAYASKALTPTEERYAQIEKEMLAIVFSMDKFRQYTYGQHTTVYSDHKPLEAILKKPLYKAPKRLQRMMIRLQDYDITVVYCKGKEMYLADTLSRAHPPTTAVTEETIFDQVNMVSFLPIREERLAKIREATEQDESLQLLQKVIIKGWPDNKNQIPAQVTPYFNFRDELSVQDGLIFRGERLVIPHRIRKDMMTRIHSSHIGIEGCLRRARISLYWPGMSSEVKQYISSCETCRTYEVSQSKETLMSHELPRRPWQKVASDLFTYDNNNYLVTVDYYSDFYELDKMPNTRSSTVIKATKSHFARYGIPEQLISDNGPQYISAEYDTFAKVWDFEHVVTSPYNSKANGKVEAAVKKAKRILRKSTSSNGDTYLAILDQRNTPTQGLESSPVQRLMNRRTRTLLPTAASLLLPRNVNTEYEREKMTKKQLVQAKYYNRKAHDLPVLDEGDVVRMKPFILGEKKWRKAVVTNRLDERSYEVQTPDATYRRNRMHLKKTAEPPPVDTDYVPDRHTDRHAASPLPRSEPEVTPTVASPTVPNMTTPTKTPMKTRSGRVVRPPAYLKNYVTY
jgi:transposase InsO family protein